MAAERVDLTLLHIPFGFSLSERFGRKFTLFLLWTVLTISIVIECVAKTWQVWLVAKLVAGAGVGTLRKYSMVLLIYIEADRSDPRIYHSLLHRGIGPDQCTRLSSDDV